MLRLRHRLGLGLGLAFATTLCGAADSRAQCSSDASSCVNCHEVSGARSILDDGGEKP